MTSVSKGHFESESPISLLLKMFTSSTKKSCIVKLFASVQKRPQLNSGEPLANGRGTSRRSRAAAAARATHASSTNRNMGDDLQLEGRRAIHRRFWQSRGARDVCARERRRRA